MHLLIPGSLPPAPVAAELLPLVRHHCPSLVERLETMTAIPTGLPPEQTGCTALEALELSRLGYQPAPGCSLGAGRAALLAGIKGAGEIVWLAELCSLSIGRDGAVLAHPDSLRITQAEADALFDSVSTLWANSPISALALGTRHWRVWLDAQVSTRSITPAAVAEMSLTDWWPDEPELRSWRRLVNEIQMVWHEHPVNLARAESGQLPINSLWLFGGAPGWTPTVEPVTGQGSSERYDGLHAPFLQADWSAWIAALPALSAHLAALPANLPLTLIGSQRSVTLSPVIRPWWRSWLPARKQPWNLWWNLPS